MKTSRYPRYRLLTGPDDAAFCSRVSAALEFGYELHGGAAITTTSDGRVYVAQAVIWPENSIPPVRPADTA